MSAEVVDFGARLSAIRLGLQAAQRDEDTADIAALYHDIEGSHHHSDPSGQVDLMDLQAALLELRAELVKKQAELLADGMDLTKALSIGAQAEVIMRDLIELATEIAGLERAGQFPD